MNRSRDKGNRLERLVVNTLRSAGQTANRVPLSGAAGGDYQDDIEWKLPAKTLRLECKARATGFKFIYDNLKPERPLILKGDNREPVFVCSLTQAIELIGQQTSQFLTGPLDSTKQQPSHNASQDTYNKLVEYTLEHGWLDKLRQHSQSRSVLGVVKPL